MRLKRTVVSLALAVGGCNAEAIPPRAPLRVATMVATSKDYVTSLTLTGEIAARAQSDVSFRVSGRVIARDVDVGSHVQAGQVLARIDSAEPQADLNAANASVTSAEALLKQASAASDRQKSLFDSGFTTRPSFDTAEQNLRTATSALDQAKAQAASAADALTYTELKAEKAGIITARFIEVGQVAQAAQAAFTLAQDGQRDAVFHVFESVFFHPPTGSGQISLVSDPSVVARGTIREVAPIVDARTGTVSVKIGIDDPNVQMPLGAAVIGRALYPPRKAIMLPWSAATTMDGRLAVWVVDPASKTVSLRRVDADSYENETLVVRDGLTPGDIVVTEGSKFLFPGENVETEQAAP